MLRSLTAAPPAPSAVDMIICTIPSHTFVGTCATSTSRSALLAFFNMFLPSFQASIFRIRCAVEVDSDCETICEEWRVRAGGLHIEEEE
jgi:hypothetical protein